MMHMHRFFTKVEKLFASLHRESEKSSSRKPISIRPHRLTPSEAYPRYLPQNTLTDLRSPSGPLQRVAMTLD